MAEVSKINQNVDTSSGTVFQDERSHSSTTTTTAISVCNNNSSVTTEELDLSTDNNSLKLNSTGALKSYPEDREIPIGPIQMTEPRISPIEQIDAKNLTDFATQALININDEDRETLEEIDSQISLFESMKEPFEQQIEAKKKEIEELEEYIEFMEHPTTLSSQSDWDAFNAKRDELLLLKSELVELENQLDSVNSSIIALCIEKLKYTDEYKAFMDEGFNGVMYRSPRDPLIRLYENTYTGILTNNPIVEINFPETHEAYKYLTDEELEWLASQKQMYAFLVSYAGRDIADEFYSSICDTRNQLIGKGLANKEIEQLKLSNGKLDSTDVNNILNVGADGLTNGLAEFAGNMIDVFSADGIVSETDYMRIYYAQYLTENSKFLSIEYSATESVGKSIATMAAGTFSPELAMAITAMSSFGAGREKALQSGASQFEALLYAALKSGSDTFLSKILSNIPGLDAKASFTLKGILKAGVDKSSQKAVDYFLNAALLGKEIDLTGATEDVINSFFVGMLSSFLINGSKELVKVTVEGFTYEVSPEKIINGGIDVSKASSDPGYFQKFLGKVSDKVFSSSVNNTISTVQSSLSDDGQSDVAAQQFSSMSEAVIGLKN